MAAFCRHFVTSPIKMSDYLCIFDRHTHSCPLTMKPRIVFVSKNLFLSFYCMYVNYKLIIASLQKVPMLQYIIAAVIIALWVKCLFCFFNFHGLNCLTDQENI